MSLISYLWQNLYYFSAVVYLLRGNNMEDKFKIKIQKLALYGLVREVKNTALLVLFTTTIGILFQIAGLFLLWKATR